MNRRRFIGVVLGAATAPWPAVAARSPNGIAALFAPDHPLQAAWTAWKTLCLLPEGRVVDGPQSASSHSEGQGYALTLAAAFDDPEAFERIMDWTEAHLAVRDDALLAWRWMPGETPPVADKNNASDGDLFYAWALASVGAHHKRPDLTKRATAIARALKAECIVKSPAKGGGTLFLPGAVGFATDAGFIVNPSYTMPRAMVDLARATGVRALEDVAKNGVALMADMAQTGLIPDWAEITAKGWQSAPQRFSPYAGYESMRTSLFAAWSGDTAAPGLARYVVASAAGDPANPATRFDRTSGAVLETSTHPGYQAVAALVACAAGRKGAPPIPPFSVDQPYYPATLHLMSLIAQAEVYPQCMPV